MKLKGIKRFFSAAVAVVLVVGLMSPPAFAETPSDQQEETPLAAVESADLTSDLQMTTQWHYGDEKEITGLGTGAIANPQKANGGWNKVYFGSNEDSGKTPLLFNVLNTHETNFGGQTMFLDCATIIENRAIGGARNNYFNSGTDYYLNHQFFETRFTTQEQNAIAQSVKLGQAPGDGMGWVDDDGGWASPFCPIKANDYAKIFILDAHEATNESYGFTDPGKTTKFYTQSFTRQKRGTTDTWWTRSMYEGMNSFRYVIVYPSGQFTYEKYNATHSGNGTWTLGISPCLNINLSSILYTSLVDPNTYKLTIKDDSIKVNAKNATKLYNTVLVPCTVSGYYDQLSLLLTDAEWTDSGWSDPDSDFVYMPIHDVRNGTCDFSSTVLDDHPGYNVYLIAELTKDDQYTDYASAPVKLTVKQNISAETTGYTGTYDGEPHGITVNVTDPARGATVKYGTAEGAYDLDASPTITDVADSPKTVYYQITADGCYTKVGSETVTILPANPEVPTGVTAGYHEALSDVPLPEGWSWVSGTLKPNSLGTWAFLANYTSTDPNVSSMSGVSIPVTVVCRDHAWVEEPSYEWSSDNSAVTAKHTCFICDAEETETVATSSAVTKQPTCSAKGETTYTAVFENEEAFTTQTKTVSNIPVDRNAHTWGAWTQTTAPTCTAAGVETRTCELDGSHVETRGVAALGHNLVFLDKWSTDGGTFHERRKCDRDGCGYIVEFTYTTDKHEHSTPARQEAKAATCTEGGLKEHWVCSCGDLFNDSDCADKHKVTAKDVITAPLGHDMGEWTQTTAPTCSASGESVRTCKRDGCTYKETRTDVIDPDAHEWGEWKQAEPPTCTKAGTDWRQCAHNPLHVETRTGAAATGHAWGAPTYEWADDYSSVIAKRTCTNDGCTASEIETAATTFVVTKQPTCSVAGETTYTATFKNEAFETQTMTVADVSVSRDAHSWGAPEYRWSDDYATVTAKRSCETNPSHQESETVMTTSRVVKNATCSAKGKTIYRSKDFANAAFSQQEITVTDIPIDASAHNWGEWVVTKKASEVEQGVEQRTCKNNPNHVETRSIPTTAHVHALTRVAAKEATCTTSGNAEYWVCDHGERPCGRFFADAAGRIEVNAEDVIVRALDHKWGEWTTDEPVTCTKTGVEWRVCSNDPSHIETREIPALGHDWQFLAQSTGDEVHVDRWCTRCDAEDHYSYEIEHEHVMTPTTGKAATCEGSGLNDYYICKYCRNIFADEKGEQLVVNERELGIQALGHDWGEWVVTKPATCSQTGVMSRTCRHDSSHVETKEIAIDPTAHRWDDGEVTVYPTCIAEGSITYTCEDDPSHVLVEAVPATGHRWDAWVVIKEATIDEEGLEQRVCKYDDQHVETRSIPKLDPEKPVYRDVVGDGSVWTKGGSEGLVFTYKRSIDEANTFSHFRGIRVDGVDVAATEYDAESGSVIVTLHPAYLETLALGDHELLPLFDDGEAAASTFTVKAASSPSQGGDEAKDAAKTKASSSGSSKAAKTGDALPFALPIALVLVVVATAAIAFYARRKAH